MATANIKKVTGKAPNVVSKPLVTPHDRVPARARRTRSGQAALQGGPLLLDIALIDEDPKQPRTNDNPGFADDRLEELAASIRRRGVKTPISVRNNAVRPGRFIINHGARRFRGSVRAGNTTIPAFIDNDYNEADQVVENLQRNELTAREIADFIGRELAKGLRKGDIAKAISKSPAFVTQHATLLDLPDPIAAAFNAGRVRDVTLINELVTAFKSTPDDVRDWLADAAQEITRGSVKLLRDFLGEKRQHEEGGFTDLVYVDHERGARQNKQIRRPGGDADDRLTRPVIEVQHNQRRAQLIVSRRPSAEGVAWIKYNDTQRECEVELARLRMISLREG